MTAPWLRVPLAEVLTERQEVPPDDALESGDIRVLAKIGFSDGKIQLRTDGQTKTGMILIRPGDLVVSGINAAKGAIAVYGEENPKPIAATIHYGAYIPKKVRVDACYLWWLLRSRVFRDLLLTYVPGGIKTELKAKRLLPIPVPLPPLSEQQRIVARIDELATKIGEARDLRRQALGEAELLWKSRAREMFASLAEARVEPLREFVTVRGGGTPSKSNPFFWDGPIPWIAPKDMKSREIWGGINHISEAATVDSPAKLLDPGSVLIVVRGMILTHTVPSALLRVPATINQDMKALVPDKSVIPEYLCSALWALNHQLLELVEKSTHDTRKLETPKLLSFEIPLPTVSEQRQIVAYLDDLQAKADVLKRLQAETAAELNALLPSVLDKAFKGDL